MAKSSVLAVLLLASCTTVDYFLDYKDLEGRPKDVNIQLPDDLADRLKAYRSGVEPWHGDPKAVADIAIRRYLDVPWRGDSFRPAVYDVRNDENAGHHVVRGYVYPSGHEMRYRVKIRAYQEIWHATQISHYKHITTQHPALDD